MKIFLFREVSLAEATALFCPTGLTVVETSAADDQESVDRLMVLALKVQTYFAYLYVISIQEHLQSNPQMLSKSTEDISVDSHGDELIFAP